MAPQREWFETDYDVPFMLQVYVVRQEKRAQIPAVTHVNGTGRLQTVTETQNPRYYHLIEAFRDETLGCGASIPNKNPSE